jgi:tetratricopeptide (TPR) repeat protein
MENWPDAEEDFRQLLQFGENGGRNRYYLGLALLGQKKYSEAIEMMAPIDESSPIFAEAVMQLAYLYRQAGQRQSAIDALKRVLKQDIHQPEIYYYLASFLDEEGDLEQAAEIVASGLQRFPDEIELLYQSAVIYEKQGNRQRALELMAKVLTIDPNYPDALNFIAYHHAEEGTELELALTRVLKALSAKKSGYIIDTLGWIYFKMGRYNESREQLEEASSLMPEDPVILEHLGDLYRALTLWEKAAEAYRKALELDPLAEGVEEKLQQMPLEIAP